jgi:hypothetical protein
MDTASPYPKRLDDAVVEAAASCVASVWHQPGAEAHVVWAGPWGVVEVSTRCVRRSPSLVEDYITVAVVWTLDEWATITRLSVALGRVAS